jgi:hypothetical protein
MLFSIGKGAKKAVWLYRDLNTGGSLEERLGSLDTVDTIHQESRWSNIFRRESVLKQKDPEGFDRLVRSSSENLQRELGWLSCPM